MSIFNIGCSATGCLAQAFDPTNVQIVCAAQLNQFIATCDVAAVDAAIRDVPRIVFAAMQSDCESLLPKLRQSDITFRNQWGHDFRAYFVHNASLAEDENKHCAKLHTGLQWPGVHDEPFEVRPPSSYTCR